MPEQPFSQLQNYWKEHFHTKEMSINIKPCPCPICGVWTTGITGICDSCEEKGYWIDPAGGIHDPDEDDPSAQYE